MNPQLTKQAIQSALADFAIKPLATAALSLFETLGYRSDKRSPLIPNSPDNFLATFAQVRNLNPDLALFADWQSVDLLFQLTDEEVGAAAGGNQQFLFDSKGIYNGAAMESYLFFAIALQKPQYTRTELSGITRAVNRLFDMPVMLLFRHGDTLTLAVINRRLHKREETKDVLEKVTLIKEIACEDPLRAHIEILHDLSLPALLDEYRFHNFVGLHEAWTRRLGSYALNERFYREVADWYFWALSHSHVTLPRAIEDMPRRSEEQKKQCDKQRSIFFIRLLTRLIFCWFLQEKRLVPRDLFRPRVVQDLLEDFSPKAGTYYRAFLQNLFFATLNQEQEKRDWRKKYTGSRAGHRGITNLWRYEDLVTDTARLEALLRDLIPFINGGLFDCLDEVWNAEEKAERKKRGQSLDDVRLDDFSEEKDNNLCLPNELFFGEEREVDLSAVYDDERRRREKVCGLVEILSRYKFTVEENTPLEEEIALDPELLGKVFENLLASYNEDTKTTARKALGAFYTPREIVSYMVDEALLAYLQSSLDSAIRNPQFGFESRLRSLFTAHADHFQNPFTPAETAVLVAAIGRVKILDPACGSGAFPMGALHRLVNLLQKLDPNNESWKRDRLAEAERYYEMLRQANAPKEELQQCEARVEDIRHSFDTRFHALDFARKLYLIENGIYGVDIQPIATQIAKLRFFIALIVDQKVDKCAPNLGVRPLPNLETKIVAADSLIPIEKPGGQMDLLDMELRPLRRQLELVRHDHFSARTPARKARCREKDGQLRARIADLLRQNGMPADSAKALAEWDPYDQNHAAAFFDSEWMFGLPVGRMDAKSPGTLRGNLALINETAGQTDLTASGEFESGFDVVIGNPPYVRIQTLKQLDPKLVEFYKEHYESAKKGNYDLYVVFVEAGLNFLKCTGQLAYILPHKFFNAQYGEPLRGLLAKGKHLQHIVHFGDQQVFPGATNYVCLLFLAKAGAYGCRFVRSDDLAEWLRTFKGTEGIFTAKSITNSEWNFAVGKKRTVFEKLSQHSRKLGEVTSHIFQGLVTSADPVYLLDPIGEPTAGFVRVRSLATNKEYELEAEVVPPLCKGALDVRRYSVLPSKRVLFPYDAKASLESGRTVLIPPSRFSTKFKRAWKYLLEVRDILEAREGGKMRNSEWYGYVYPKSVALFPREKILTPSIASAAAFAYDSNGEYYFVGSGGGAGGGYGILLSPDSPLSYRFVLGLLNSQVADFFVHNTSTTFRGGYYAYSRQYLEGLPVPSATPAQDAAVVGLVDYLLWLNVHFAEHETVKTARDALMLGYWEQILNGLVYELYFADELHANCLRLFDLVARANLPALDDLPKPTRPASLRQLFETLYATNHPLRGALFNLGSLETVRIIEGRE